MTAPDLTTSVNSSKYAPTYISSKADLDDDSLWTIQTYVMHISILQRNYISDVVKAEIILESRWKGQKMKEWMKIFRSSEYWTPNIGIVNSLGRLRITSKMNQYTEQGVVYFIERKRFRGRFVQRPSWVLFPFDVQKLRFILSVVNKEFPIEFKIDPRGSQPGQSSVYSCLEIKEYIAGEINYKTTAEFYNHPATIDAFVPIYRNSFTYISYFFYDFTIGCMALMPYAMPDSYCDFRMMFYIILFMLFVVSELKSEYLRPSSGDVSYMDRYHSFILFFLNLNFIISSLQTLYLGISRGESFIESELYILRTDVVLFFLAGTIFLMTNAWFLIVIAATFRRLVHVLRKQNRTFSMQK